MIARAAAAGWDTLMLTVDTPVASARLRDARNGLTIPPALTPSTLASMAVHPAWWANLLTTAPLEFALLRESGLSPAQIAAQAFNPSLTFDALAWIRKQWPGSLVVKGVQSLADARALAEVASWCPTMAGANSTGPCARCPWWARSRPRWVTGCRSCWTAGS